MGRWLAVVVVMMMGAPGYADHSHKAGSVWVTLSDSWTLVKTEGPQLLQASLPPQANLFVWKFRSGGLPVEQFVPNLAKEWGWTDVAVQPDASMLDPRFGQVHSWLYRKAALYGSFDHYNKVYAFRDDAGEIMIFQFQSPEDQYAALSGEYLTVFSKLATVEPPAPKREPAAPQRPALPAPQPRKIQPPPSPVPASASGAAPAGKSAAAQGDIWSDLRNQVMDKEYMGTSKGPSAATPTVKPAAPASGAAAAGKPAASANAPGWGTASPPPAKTPIAPSPAIPDFFKESRSALPQTSSTSAAPSVEPPRIGEGTPPVPPIEQPHVPAMDAHGEVARMVNTILSAPPTPALPIDVISRFTFYRETDDGVLGFDLAANTVSLLDVSFKPVKSIPMPGTPYFTDLGIYFLTEQYAYQVQIRAGELVTEREDIFLFLNRRRQWASVIPLSEAAMPETWSASAVDPVAVGATSASGGSPLQVQGQPAGKPDAVLTVLNDARAVYKTKGAKAAAEVLLMEKERLEATHSVHLYDYYFTLGEYWEELGDIDTALMYYRQGARMMD